MQHDRSRTFQKAPFFPLAALYLTLGLLAVVGRLSVDAGFIEMLPRLRWTTIHLVTIGSLTQALFGALPHLVGTAGDATGDLSPRSRWFQWLLLNAGFPLILLGMTTGETLLAVAGATLVLAALGFLLASVFRVASRATTESPILAYYRTAPWFLVVGILAAFGMLLGYYGPGGYFGILEAHVHANVWGFLALVAAGTLTAVVPAITGSPLPSERWQRWSVLAIAVGAAGLVSGPWLAIHAITFAGLPIYVVGTVGLLANLVRSARPNCRKDSRFAHVIGAYLWLVVPVPFAPFVLLTPDLVPGAAIEVAAIDGLVFGWMLQLAMAFLPAVVGADRVSGFLDVPAAIERSPSRPSWVGLVAVNLGMAALWLTAFPAFDAVADPLSLAGYALIAIAWAGFVVRLWSALVGSATSGGRAAEPTATTTD